MKMISLVNSDARKIPLRDGCVQCVVTSPPFFNLRDYDSENQIGHEADLLDYVTAIVDVFEEVRRVLRPDGVAWLNLGNKYASSGGDRPENFKRGDLIGVPWMVAMALQMRGWWLRADCIWNKTNPIPDPVKGWRFEYTATGMKLLRGSWRPSRTHEYVFMLAKSQKYYSDGEPVREEPAAYTRKGGSADYTANGSATHGKGSSSFHQMNPNGANKRSVWNIPTAQWPGEHCATFPPELVRPCLKSSTPAGGCCSVCEAPWARVRDTETFFPTCRCLDASPKPSLVLDPFVGSGTMLQEARDLGLRGVGMDLNFDYLLKDARERLDIRAVAALKLGLARKVLAPVDFGPLFQGR
jgi:DNA modification methylase